jgi:hypothetical protein
MIQNSRWPKFGPKYQAISFKNEKLLGWVIMLALLAFGFAIWLAVSAYFVHQELYNNMMGLLQINYHWCMLAHTEDGHYSVCTDELDAGFKSLYQGWRACYEIAFYNNWFVEIIRWGF